MNKLFFKFMILKTLAAKVSYTKTIGYHSPSLCNNVAELLVTPNTAGHKCVVYIAHK